MAKQNKKNQFKSYANFLFEVGALDRTPRSGLQRHLGGWTQSVSEHTLRTAYVGLVLAQIEKEKDPSISIERVIEICLYHDLGEARATDLDYISQRYSASDEQKAIQDATRDLPISERILKGYEEIEERRTPEGVIAMDADNIELILSMREVSENGNKNADSWAKSAAHRLKLKSAKELAKTISKTGTNEWWLSYVTDEKGIARGNKKGNRK